MFYHASLFLVNYLHSCLVSAWYSSKPDRDMCNTPANLFHLIRRDFNSAYYGWQKSYSYFRTASECDKEVRCREIVSCRCTGDWLRENPDYANQTGQARNHERLAWQSGGRATIKIKRRTTPYEELNCLVWECLVHLPRGATFAQNRRWPAVAGTTVSIKQRQQALYIDFQ